VFLAGVSVPDRLVLKVASRLHIAGFNDIGGRLEAAVDTAAQLLALSVFDRDTILGTLIDCPPGLGELRATLLQQKAWRAREGTN
jgi:hypothetical protein